MAIAEGIARAFEVYSAIERQKMAQAQHAQAEKRLALEEELRRADLDLRRATESRQEKQQRLAQERQEASDRLSAFERGAVPITAEQAGGESSIELEPGFSTTAQGRTFEAGNQRFYYPTREEAGRLDIEQKLRQAEALRPLTHARISPETQKELGIEAEHIPLTSLDDLLRARSANRPRSAAPRMFSVTDDEGRTTIIEAAPGQQPVERPVKAKGKTKTPPKSDRPSTAEASAQRRDTISRLTSGLLTVANGDPGKAEEILRKESKRPESSFGTYYGEILLQLRRMRSKDDSAQRQADKDLGGQRPTQ